MSSLPVDPHLFMTFLGVMAAMAITPGPANLFAVATGAQRGRAAALTSVIGMNMATLVWFGAAALGLGALVMAFPQVFQIIAIGGALYVAWLGLKSIKSALATPKTTADAASPDLATRPLPASRHGALRDGFMVQIANPKAILFFTAVLPPFLDIKRAIGPQLGLIAMATISMDVVAMSLYALGGVALAAQMSQPRFQRGFGLFVGTLLLVVAGLITLRLFD